MAIALHIMKESGSLLHFCNTIESAFSDVVKRIESALPRVDADVVVVDNPSAAIPETGVGGYSPTAHLVYVNIDPSSDELMDRIGSEIMSTVAHELHHCARWDAIGYGSTLLEAVISEGLAEHFDIEINKSPAKLWSTALPAAELEALLLRAQSEFENKEYDHASWFFGSDDKRIPRWTGYSLGFHLVGKYMRASNRSASELVATAAGDFVLSGS